MISIFEYRRYYNGVGRKNDQPCNVNAHEY